MNVSLLYGNGSVAIKVPDTAHVYTSQYPQQPAPANTLVANAIASPLGDCKSIPQLVEENPGEVVIVVSDITRPIPYADFLGVLLAQLEQCGVADDAICILVATGMHRASTAQERLQILGKKIASRYHIEDHDASDEHQLVPIGTKSWAGSTVKLNRRFMQAGLRIITGLVEPHFMAGFSGGRKAVCPGLACLDTIRKFHGYTFLNNPHAANGVVEGNPCHEESLSVAKAVDVHFSLNVVLNNSRQVAAAFAGELETAHSAACDFVRKCAFREVPGQADLAIVSSGGYPLDTTFYQCVKGFVSCLPSVKKNGTTLALGSCTEEIGSQAYTDLMLAYSGKPDQFIQDIAREDSFTKDQWQFQMHCKTLDHVGEANLVFVTHGIPATMLSQLSVNGIAVSNSQIGDTIQEKVDAALKAGASIAVFPEGPYCVPFARSVI